MRINEKSVEKLLVDIKDTLSTAYQCNDKDLKIGGYVKCTVQLMPC